MSLSLLRNSAKRFAVRAASREPVRPRFNQVFSQRGYTSGHSQEKSSDLPWLIGSVTITVPAIAYLLYSPQSKSDHDSHGSHDGHGAEHAKHDEPTREPVSKAEAAEEHASGNESATEEAQPVEKQDEKKGENPQQEAESDVSGSEEGGSATPTSSVEESDKNGEKSEDS